MAPTEPDRSDVVVRARRVADDVLAPRAEVVDQADRVPASHLQVLADEGLFGLAGATSDGGLDVAPGTFRRVVAAIGGGCGATFFVWVQHHGVVRTLSSSRAPFSRELLGPLCAGDVVAGTAFAHVRRSTSPVTATPTASGGWRLAGAAPWATSWGLADWFTVAAVADDRLVWGLVRAGDAGIEAEPLPLPVFGATRTVSLRFDIEVPAERIVDVADLAAWQAADARRAAMVQPAVLGVAERACRLLRDLGDDDAVATADALDHERVALWDRDDALVAASGAGDDVIAAASRHRADALDHARVATSALLAAVGGRGMALDHPAQRLAREATFYVIQAQTGAGRAAMLAGARRRP